MTVTDHTVLLSSQEGLLHELDAIAIEGWEGQRARCLLAHVRVAIVHPQVVSARRAIRNEVMSAADPCRLGRVYIPDTRGLNTPG